MAEALAESGWVSEEMKERALRNKAVNEELDSDKVVARRKTELTKKMNELIRCKDLYSKAQVQDILDTWSEEYWDVFDEIAVNFVYKLNLGKR
jgi:flagellar biosynthesis component FlhA